MLIELVEFQQYPFFILLYKILKEGKVFDAAMTTITEGFHLN